VGEWKRTAPGYLDILWNKYFLHHLAKFHQLRRSRLWVGLQLSALTPVVRIIMMRHVTEQQTPLRPVNNHANVQRDPHEPKIVVLGLIKLMELQAWVSGV